MDFQLSVAWTVPLVHHPQTLIAPIAWLADCSQRVEGEVTIGEQNGRLIAQWTDRGMPVERDYDPIAADEVPPVPAPPSQWSENSPELLTAVRAAMATTDPDSQRYALGCIQLSGVAGRIAATDSRQALVQTGFTFPWTDDVLIPARKVFEALRLPQDAAVRIGRTEHQVFFAIGSWTIAIAVETDQRFPDVQRIIPAPSAVRTRLQLDPEDARFVAERIDQLPRTDDLHQTVTVDLNGSIAVRSRRSHDATATELVLRRSHRDGEEVRLTTDRRPLRRAIELGFTEIGFTSDEGPAVCRDATREFVWALLASGDAVPASENVHQVDSLTAPSRPSRIARHLASADVGRTTVGPAQRATKPITHAATRRAPHRNSPMPKPSGTHPSNGDLIAQLLDLRKQVRAIEQAVVAVAQQLRARRKQQQLMKTTLASLKQLQTLDV